MNPRDEVVLITGATGVIGSALVAELRNAGYQIVRGISKADVDLTDASATTEFLSRIGPNLVFHLAARVYGVGGNAAHRTTAFLDNIRINTNVVEACRLSGVRKVIAMGSTAVYSDMVPLPMREDNIWLGPPHKSEAPYAHAKRAMLAQLEAYKDDDGPDYAFCISTNLFGPHDKFDEKDGHVIPSLISKFHKATSSGALVEVWGTGTPERDFLYSLDAATAIRLIGEKYSGCINVASGKTISIADAVDTIARVADYRRPLQWDRSKPDGQARRGYDVSILHSLGFRPRYTFEEGIAETYRWYAENFRTARR